MRPTRERTLPGEPVPDESPAPDTDRVEATTGDVLRERYVLEEHVATGATAGVWRGFDRELRRTIAVKLLRADREDQERAAARFRREAVTAARLTHPGIVAVYDTGTDDDVTWLAIEHVDGPDLLTVLRHHPTGLPDTTAAAIVEQAAIAVGVAHARGVVHRDIKPANLLVSTDGVVKISDFGIAAAVGEPIALVEDVPVGTAAYAPPEQLRGGLDADPRMDVFALGVVLFEALTGRAAFPSKGPGNDRSQPLRPRRVRADVDRALDSVVARATAIDPAARFRDGAHLAAALRTLVPVEPRALAAEAVATVLGHRAPTDITPIAVARPTSLGARLRWLGLVVGVLVSVGVAAAVLTGAGPGVQDGVVMAADAGAPIREVRLYDPYNSVEDEPRRLLEVVDGDRSTAWTTPAYPRPLRSLGTPGVGVRIDLGEPVTIDRVQLGLGITGVTVEVLAREDRPPAGSTEVDWTFLARAVDAPGEVTLDTAGTTARHWLVWFTTLEQTGESWQASLTDVTFDTSNDQ